MSRTRLRELREAVGKSQAQVAHELGVSKATFSTWETGKVALKADALLILAAYFGCTPNEVLGVSGRSRYLLATDDEVRLVALYRKLPPNVRIDILDIMQTVAKR